MVFRTITWTIDEGLRVTPQATQEAGIQGEHNATEVAFVLPDELQEEGYRYYVEYVGGDGMYDVSGALELADGEVTMLLPRAWTQGGGTATLRLIAEEETTGVVAYSVEGRIRYRDRQPETEAEQSLLQGAVVAAVRAAESAAAEAKDKARAAEGFRDGANEWAAAALGYCERAEAAKGNLDEAVNNANNYANAAATSAGQAADSASAAATSAGQAAEQAAEEAVARVSEELANEVKNAAAAATAAAASAGDAKGAAERAEGAKGRALEYAKEALDAKDVAEDAAEYAKTAVTTIEQQWLDASNKYNDLVFYAGESYRAEQNAITHANVAAAQADLAAESAAEARQNFEDTEERVEKVEQVADKVGCLIVRTAGQELLHLSDISHREHRLTVSVSGGGNPTDVKVRRCGRNLLPHPDSYANGKSKVNGGVTFNVNIDGSVSTTGKATGVDAEGNPVPSQFYFISSLKTAPYTTPNVRYCFSCRIKDSDGNDVTDELNKNRKTHYFGITGTIRNEEWVGKFWPSYTTKIFTPLVDEFGNAEPYCSIHTLGIKIPPEADATGLIFYPMFEVLEDGDTPGEWESPENNEDYDVNEDGTVDEVSSLYPVTNLLTDTPGALVTCEYLSSGVKKPWVGKTWVAVGDSLTMDTYYTTKAYHTYIGEESGIHVVNLGIGGTGFIKENENGGLPYYDRIEDNIPADADVVTIMGGLNDVGAGKEIGSPDNNTTDTFCGCVNATIDKVYAALQNVALGIIFDPPNDTHRPTASGDSTIEQYCAAVEQICRMRGIPFLDLLHTSGLRPWEENCVEVLYSKTLVGDKTHLNEEGHALLAPKIKAFLETLIL